MNISHKLLASCSSASYVGVSKLRELGFTEVLKYKNKNTVAYICVHKPSRQIVVVFRGSDDWKDWKINLNFLKVKSPFNRSIHGGFQSAYNDVREGVEGYLDQLAGWTLFCCGHSLGGALASICAVQSGAKFKQVVVFGCPKVFGSNSHINLSNYNVIRYVNKADLVCRIPTVGYDHSGDCYFINNQGNIRINPSGAYMLANGFWKFWNWFSDHSIDEYIKALK